MQTAIQRPGAESQYTLTIATSEGTYFISPADIIRMEASSNYTCMYFTNRKPLVISRILGEYEIKLAGLGFVRTHRSHLVNKKYVLFVDSEGTIIMKDTSKAEISRRKKKEVMKKLREGAMTTSWAA